MNVKKTVFVIGGLGVILILLAVRFGWIGKQKVPVRTEKSSKELSTKVVRKTAEQIPAKSKSEKTPPRTEEKVPPVRQKKAASPVLKDDFGAGDPFAYASSSTGEYSPLSGNKHVGVITVKGIIRMKNEEPRAILHLKDSDRVHYVSKDSVVRISTKNKKGSTPAEAYIVVKDIRNDEVELIQLERPDKVIIIR